MKVWNKETRNEQGEFYRKQDWGIEREPDFLTNHPRACNFTSTPPIMEADGTPVKQDWNGDQWVEDTALTDDERAAKIERLMAKDINVNKHLYYIWLALDAIARGEQPPAKAVAIANKVKQIQAEIQK